MNRKELIKINREHKDRLFRLLFGDARYKENLLSLYNAFLHPDTSGEFEWTATMIALNPGQNLELLEKCRPLKEYTIFVNTIKTNMKVMPLEDAVEKTIKECIAQGILSEFLRAHRAEVLMSCITEFDKELYEMDLREEARELGLAEGRAQGLAEGRLKNLVENTSHLMKSLNLPFDEVCKLLEITGEDYDYVKKNIM